MVAATVSYEAQGTTRSPAHARNNSKRDLQTAAARVQS